MHVSIRMAAVVLSFICAASFVMGQTAPRGEVAPRETGPARPQPARDPREATTAPRTTVDPRLAGAQALPARTPQAPPWWPQSEAHQKYVQEVLGFWEQSSAKIERYQCTFRRWEYDPVWGPPVDPKTGTRPAVRVSYGDIKFGAPDKGLFQVNKITHFTPGKPTEKPQYLPKEGEFGEHWVCDGKSVFQFDHANKKLIEHQLPPDMQGKAIVDGPLPFLFGADAKKIQARYWVGVFTPPSAKNEYWLEAWPKFREDAKNYKKVEIIIDEADFLPKAIQIYDHNGKEGDPSSTVLTFDDRKVNMDLRLLKSADPLHWTEQTFIAPKAPFGYKKEVIKFDAASGETASKPRGTQASRPQIPLRKQ